MDYIQIIPERSCSFEGRTFIASPQTASNKIVSSSSTERTREADVYRAMQFLIDGFENMRNAAEKAMERI